MERGDPGPRRVMDANTDQDRRALELPSQCNRRCSQTGKMLVVAFRLLL